MFVKEVSVDISAWGFPSDKPVKLKRMSAQGRAEWTNELARLSNLKMAGKRIDSNLQPGMSDIIYLEKIITEAPFTVSRDGIGQLDWELIAYLAQEGERLNAPLVMKESEDDSSLDSSTPGP